MLELSNKMLKNNGKTCKYLQKINPVGGSNTKDKDISCLN